MLREHAVPFIVGLLFALGLGIGGMTDPQKIISFLDIGGDWDPSLMLVMATAAPIYGLAFRFIKSHSTPRLAPRFQLPTRRDIDGPLVIGAVLFGVGWGLSGYCPGPGLTSLPSLSPSALAFVASLAAGMGLHKLYQGFKMA